MATYDNAILDVLRGKEWVAEATILDAVIANLDFPSLSDDLLNRHLNGLLEKNVIELNESKLMYRLRDPSFKIEILKPLNSSKPSTTCLLPAFEPRFRDQKDELKCTIGSLPYKHNGLVCCVPAYSATKTNVFEQFEETNKQIYSLEKKNIKIEELDERDQQIDALANFIALIQFQEQMKCSTFTTENECMAHGTSGNGFCEWKKNTLWGGKCVGKKIDSVLLRDSEKKAKYLEKMSFRLNELEEKKKGGVRLSADDKTELAFLQNVRKEYETFHEKINEHDSEIRTLQSRMRSLESRIDKCKNKKSFERTKDDGCSEKEIDVLEKELSELYRRKRHLQRTFNSNLKSFLKSKWFIFGVSFIGGIFLLKHGVSSLATTILDTWKTFISSSANASIQHSLARSAATGLVDVIYGKPTLSDYRFKKYIKYVGKPLTCGKGKQLQFCTFTWRKEATKRFGLEGKDYGVIAQDVQKVFPDCVVETPEYLMVNYARLLEKIKTNCQTCSSK